MPKQKLCRLEYICVGVSGWAKQNSENSGLFRNFLNAFWLSYPHPHSIGPFLCRKFSLIILCILLFARVHFRISCIYEKDVQKEKVNTGMTRIFRQHKFIAFRYLNVYYKKPKPKLKSLYVLLVSEIFAESKITSEWIYRIIFIFGKLKSDILYYECCKKQSGSWISSERRQAVHLKLTASGESNNTFSKLCHQGGEQPVLGGTTSTIWRLYNKYLF